MIEKKLIMVKKAFIIIKKKLNIIEKVFIRTLYIYQLYFLKYLFKNII